MRSVLSLSSPREDRRDPSIHTDAVYVVYTTLDETLRALHAARGFAEAMQAPLTLLHFRIVPYPLPVEVPAGTSPVPTQEFAERLAQENLSPEIYVHLCRDERVAIPAALQPHSLVVIGGSSHWWQRSAERWRRILEAAGHFVMVVEATPVKEDSRA